MTENETSSRDVSLRGPPKGRTDGSLIAFPRSQERPSDNLLLVLTSFIWREQEVAEVKSLLADRRLLTLHGSGGCGKARLALAVAQDLVKEFDDGVWWVELASLSDPKLVPGAVASALGVRKAPDRSLTEALVEHLKSREALLGRMEIPHLLGRALRFVPAAVLTAFVIPLLLYENGALKVSLGNEQLLAGLVAALIAWRTRSVLVTLGGVMATLWTLQAVGQRL